MFELAVTGTLSLMPGQSRFFSSLYTIMQYLPIQYKFLDILSPFSNNVSPFSNVYLYIFSCLLTWWNSVQRKRPAVSQAPSICSKGATVPVVLNAKKPWPTIVTLPTQLRPDVIKTLRNGEKLAKKQRTSFIRSIYDHFSLYTV